MRPWLIVAGDFTPLGGMDRANHALATAAASSGRTVHVVAHRVWPDLAQRQGVRPHLVSRPGGSHMLGAPLLRAAGRRYAREIAANRGRIVANGGNVDSGDAVWMHYVHAAYTPEIAAGPVRRAVAAAAHAWYRESERRSVDRASLVICNSERTATDVRERLSVPGDRVKVVHYGIDPDAFPMITPQRRADARQALNWDDRPIALFVGALGDRRKGFDTLFEAWRILCADRGWDVDLAVAGDGHERAVWQARARRHGMRDRIHFLGFRDDVARVMAASDVLVHPARYEAYGLGVHEATCTGLPAIVSASSGVAENLAGDLSQLLLQRADDAEELAARLRTWRSTQPQCALRAQRAGASLRMRTWQHMAREIEALLDA